IGNPLGWVQSRLLGGWRRAVTVGVLYLLVAFGAMLILFRAVPWSSSAAAGLSTFTRGVLVLLSVFQAILFVFVSTSTVSRAVQRDVTSGMIDSHRLTPMSGIAIILGYLTGPNLMLVPLTAANTLLALGLSLLGGHPPEVWLLGVLVAFCIGFT